MMLKLYFWIVMELLLLICSFGIVLPATISAADTNFVILGFAYLLGFCIPLGMWYLPRRIWKCVEEVERKIDEEANFANVDPDWPNGVQQSSPRKRGSASKSVGK